MALGDVDRDGSLDLVAGNYGHTNKLYRRQLPYHTGQGQAGSLQVDAEVEDISGALLTATADLPPNTSINYYLSNNGGSRWFLVHPGEPFSFPNTGTDLRWKVELTSLSPVLTPRIDQIVITRQYYVYLPLVIYNP